VQKKGRLWGFEVRIKNLRGSRGEQFGKTQDASVTGRSLNEGDPGVIET